MGGWHTGGRIHHGSHQLYNVLGAFGNTGNPLTERATTDVTGPCFARTIIGKVPSIMRFLQPQQAIQLPSIPFSPGLKRGKK